MLVLENKIEPSSELSHLVNARPADDGPSRKLRIGYFGLLRCQWSWQVLEALAKKQPDQIEIKVAGHPLCPINIEERAKQFQNITFLGTYQSPAGLPALYDDVDLVWACYPGPDVDDNDMRWAQLVCRSNRFYESCFFQRPTITVAGSGDAKEVQRYDLGFIVHDQRIESVVESILKIQPKQLEKWQANLRELPRHVFEYSNEIEQLREAVAQLINPKLIIASSGEPIGTNPERHMKSPTSDC